MVQALTGAHLDPFLRKVSILGVTSHLRKFHEIVQVKTADYRTRETATTNYKICENNLYVHICKFNRTRNPGLDQKWSTLNKDWSNPKIFF